MDFIERLWSISPDAGSGVTELCFILVPMILVGWMAAVRRSRGGRDSDLLRRSGSK